MTRLGLSTWLSVAVVAAATACQMANPAFDERETEVDTADTKADAADSKAEAEGSSDQGDGDGEPPPGDGDGEPAETGSSDSSDGETSTGDGDGEPPPGDGDGEPTLNCETIMSPDGCVGCLIGNCCTNATLGCFIGGDCQCVLDCMAQDVNKLQVCIGSCGADPGVVVVIEELQSCAAEACPGMCP